MAESNELKRTSGRRRDLELRRLHGRRLRWAAGVVGFGTLLACGGESGEEGARKEEVSARTPAPPPRVNPMDLPDAAQTVSFLGDTLYTPERPPEVLAAQEEQLRDALEDLEAHPRDADALIWVGRRYAYLGEYRHAIDAFTRGLQLHPDDPRFLRHRGHRFITVREPDLAIADFRTAAEIIEGTADQVEPDGQPNALGIPTSTLHFNIWYHYGLAHYIKGEFAEAAEIYRRCMGVSEHADSRVATAHWWYMTLRRLGRDEEARELIQGLDLETLAEEIIESGGYLELLRLYAGEVEETEMAGTGRRSLEGATTGYGYGNWLLYNGDTEGAREVFQAIVDARDQWAAFGYIAAEAELARMERDR